MVKLYKRKTTRRQFLVDTSIGLCGAAFVGVGLTAYSSQSLSVPALSLRPPGALAESKFQASCVRCGLCVRACPYDILKLANFFDSTATGTPYFNARTGPCEMCEDIPCVEACPTGALDKGLQDIDAAKMGLAVLLDEENCLNFQGLRCDVCYRVCPAIDSAITLEVQRNSRTGHHAMFIPTVHSDACTGCGKCEQSCVLEEAAIKVLPLHIAKGELGKHYRWGWEEKDKAGHSLIKPMIDLPDRKPGGFNE